MIRSLETQDIKKLFALHESIFQTSFDFSEYTSLHPYHYAIVIEHEQEIIGYLVAQIVFEQTDLYYVAVKESHKRCGYGKMLMDEYFLACMNRGVSSLSLEVRTSNQRAISLYEKYGYEKVAVRKNYYENGEDALLMLKTLGE